MGKAAAELLELSLAQAARLVKTREISPVDLVGASLYRINAVDKRLSAYITVFEDEARKVAEQAVADLQATLTPAQWAKLPDSMKTVPVARGFGGFGGGDGGGGAGDGGRGRPPAT